MKSLNFFENHPFCGNQNKIDYTKTHDNTHTKTHTVTIVVCKKKNHSFWSTLNIYLFSSIQSNVSRYLPFFHII
jgi:hypothetical protein